MLPRGVRRVVRPARGEIDLELRHHVEMTTAQLIEQGHDPDEARRLALECAGDLAAYRSACEAESGRVGVAERSADGLASLRVALGQSIRALARAPGYTAAVVVSLALGIGATTTVFSFADAILLRPLPYPEPDRLVVLRHEAPGVAVLRAEQSDGTYLHYRAHSSAFEEIGTWYENVVTLSGVEGEEPERVPVAMVSSTLFDVLGARPAVGRLPVASPVRSPGDAPDVYERGASEGNDEVLLSYDLWQRRYGGDPEIVGRTIEANRAPKLVIGVLEEGFAFPRPEIGLWYPEDPDPASANAADMYKLAVGRLARGYDADAAARDLDRLILTLPESYPDLSLELIQRAQLRAIVVPLADEVIGEADRALWLLLGGMAALLLIACVNVANLVLVRAEHRQRDVAVRTALGAARGDLLRMFGMESLVLAVLAGVLGLAMAVGAVELLVSLVPPDGLPRLAEVRVSGRVVAFGAMLSLLVAATFALVPALRGNGRGVASALKEGAAATSSGSRSAYRARRALVASQVALALTLLVGGALMYRSFRALQRADVGFDADGVLTARIAMPYRGYETYALAESLWRTLLERVRALPGVQSAGAVSGLPLVPEPAYYDLAIDVEESSEMYAGMTSYHVMPSYFDAMRIPIVEGLDVIGGAAAFDAPVVLSAAAAKRLFPNGSPIGQRIRRTAGPGPWWTVAAVVGDVPDARIGGDPAELIYIPVLQKAADPRWIPSQATLVVRADVPPAALAPQVRAIVRELDPNLPVANVRPMRDIVSASMARTSFTMLLLVVAGVTALVLGIVGVYGVTSYAVGRRTQEIGLRVALGARAPDVERMVLADGARTIAVGVGAGLLVSWAAGGVLASLLYGVTARDPYSFAAVTLLLVLAATLSTWLPARRAARVAPTEALRTR